MNPMKKFLSIVLVILMVAALLAGCAPAAQTPAAEPAKSEEPAQAAATPAPAKADEPAPADEPSAAPADEGVTGPRGVKYKDFMADGELKVAFVCKFLASVFFNPMSAYMEEKFTENGVKFLAIDSNNKEDLFLGGVQNAIQQDCDLVLITPPTTALGAAAAEMCDAAGVVIMSSTDPCYDQNGDLLPHVGLDDYGMGHAHGVAVGEIAKERGFFEDLATVKVAMLDAPKVEAFAKRLQAGKDGLMETVPELTDDHFIQLDTKDGLLDNDITQFTNCVQANPDVKRWIVLGGDEGAFYATAQVLDENKFPLENALCGSLGGTSWYWDYMNKGGKYTALAVTSTYGAKPIGYASAETAIQVLKSGGKDLPAFTGSKYEIATSENWAKIYKSELEEYTATGEFTINPEFADQLK